MLNAQEEEGEELHRLSDYPSFQSPPSAPLPASRAIFPSPPPHTSLSCLKPFQLLKWKHTLFNRSSHHQIL